MKFIIQIRLALIIAFVGTNTLWGAAEDNTGDYMAYYLEDDMEDDMDDYLDDSLDRKKKRPNNQGTPTLNKLENRIRQLVTSSEFTNLKIERLHAANQRQNEEISSMKQSINELNRKLNFLCTWSSEGTCDTLRIGPEFSIENTENDPCLMIRHKKSQNRSYETCYGTHGVSHKFFTDPASRTGDLGQGPQFFMSKYNDHITVRNYE